MNVIITGASGGIGKALVERFCENGDNVWACLRSEHAGYKEWLQNCARRNGVWAQDIYFNLTDSEEIKNGFREIQKEKKQIDVLINNAGVGHMNLFQMTPLDTIRNVFEINLFSAMQMSQLVMRIMVRQKHGIIINVSSTAATEIYVGNTIYGASKAALSAFTQSLAAEAIQYGIRVNAIAPGLTDTRMSHVFEGNNPELPLERSAIGRKLDPLEIADVAVALTSEKMRMINGQIIRVNGGAK